ncbi:glycerophosphodiester phosphodiesterase [Bacillus wiedmannii]|uniref:glycerophosphodiester phosphodiesterase n=1 Tax=Bacillus wiedmannii TaxID=1890302 RepID=UPI002E2470D3|nr:glycerophosphodiester phosphodiesterase [Bacillus wiedmannii]
MPEEKYSATKLIGYSFQTIYASFWRIIGFEILYKLTTVFIFIPFLKAIFFKLLILEGSSNHTNEELLKFFISKFGILFLLICIPLSMLFIFIEFSVLTIMAYYSHKQRKVTIRSALKKTISGIPIFISFCLPVLALYLLFIIPFINIGFNSSLIPSIEIPKFITGELFKTFHWKVAYYGLLAVLMYFNIRWIFTIPIMVLEGKSFRHAARKSSKMIKLHYKKLIKVALMLGLLLSLLPDILYGSIDLIDYLFETSIIGSTTEMINKYLLAIVYANYLFITGFIATPFIIVIITQLYVQKVDETDITLDEHGLDFLQIQQGKSFFKKHKYKFTFVYLIAMVCFLATITIIASIIPSYEKPLTIAHRGNINTGVENTLESVQGAIDTKSDYAEIDILQAKDGGLVVIHDTKLSRLAHINANVYEKTTEELKALTLEQNGFTGKISTLDEIMKLAKGKIKLNIEVKLHGHEQHIIEKLMETIKRNNFEKGCIIQTLHYELIPQIKKANPHLQVGYVLFASVTDLHVLRGDFFVLEEYMVTKEVVQDAKELRKPLYVWTVNDHSSMYDFLEMGVDGIITDNPSFVHEVLGQLPQERTYFDLIVSIENFFEKLFQTSLTAKSYNGRDFSLKVY